MILNRTLCRLDENNEDLHKIVGEFTYFGKEQEINSFVVLRVPYVLVYDLDHINTQSYLVFDIRELLTLR